MDDPGIGITWIYRTIADSSEYWPEGMASAARMLETDNARLLD